MNRIRFAIALGGAAVLLGGPAFAQEAPVVTPAPPGEASAVAAKVGEVVAVAETEARTDANAGQATANAIEVGGNPPLGQLGGTQNGPGATSGALLDTGENQGLRVAVAPWDARVEESGGTRRAVGNAALARLLVGPNLLEVHVLQSTSETTHTAARSTGRGSSDGVVLKVGGDNGLVIVLLHADSASEGGALLGQTFVVSLNGNRILAQDQPNGCALELPNVVGLNCLQVSSGLGGIAGAVANVLPGTPIAAQVVGASGRGASAPAAPVNVGELGGGSALPRTGTDLLRYGALLGFGLIGLGGLALAASRVPARRPAPVPVAA